MKNKYSTFFLFIYISILLNSCAIPQSYTESHQKPFNKAIAEGISIKLVKEVIDDHLDEITNCYEKETATAHIEGRIVYKWSIDNSGKVETITILSSTVPQANLVACIKSSIKSWKFPIPKDGKAIVCYPFVFKIMEL